jgi:hypothetical protein
MSMNDTRPPAELSVPDDDEESGRNAAVIAADDTGLLSNEIQIVEVELREGEVTRTE